MLKNIFIALMQNKNKCLAVLAALALVFVVSYVSQVYSELSSLRQDNYELNHIVSADRVSIDNLNMELLGKDNIIRRLDASLSDCYSSGYARQEDQKQIDEIMGTEPVQPPIKSDIVKVSIKPISNKQEVSHATYVKGIDFINRQFAAID